MIPKQGRKALLATHICVAVGWIGAVVAYIALDLSATFAGDVLTIRSAFVGMALVAQWVILPLALATLGTGIAISLLTSWGLFRHWWVVFSLLLTVFATAVLIVEVRVILDLADIAADPATDAGRLQALPGTLLHSIGGLVLLLFVLTINVYKPRGLTRRGWRKRDGGSTVRLDVDEST